MKIEIDGRKMTVHRRHKTWEEASSIVAFERMNPPDGYRVLTGFISRRTQPDGRWASGRLCNSVVEYEHCDRRHEPFDLDEAYDFFRSESSGRSEPGSASREG